MSNFKVYTPEQMSNEDYHSEVEHVSGSALCTIHEFSPAHWRFGEQKETPALEFGIASHAALLEPDKFSSEFVRGLDKGDYPNALTSDAAMKLWLKERGIKGYSTKTKQELVEMIRKTGEDVVIWSELQSEFEELHSDKTEVKPQWFDDIAMMREVIFNDAEYKKRLSTGFAEYSIFGEIDGVKVKIRPDIITETGEIWDYKTTVSCHPERFGRDAFYRGYLLKMALQHDMFERAYGRRPAAVVLLAQEKKPPFIAQAYELTAEQLDIGRSQYKAALRQHSACMATDSWPAYGGGVQALELPEFIYKQNQ